MKRRGREWVDEWSAAAATTELDERIGGSRGDSAVIVAIPGHLHVALVTPASSPAANKYFCSQFICSRMVWITLHYYLRNPCRLCLWAKGWWWERDEKIASENSVKGGGKVAEPRKKLQGGCTEYFGVRLPPSLCSTLLSFLSFSSLHTVPKIFRTKCKKRQKEKKEKRRDWSKEAEKPIFSIIPYVPGWFHNIHFLSDRVSPIS